MVGDRGAPLPPRRGGSRRPWPLFAALALLAGCRAPDPNPPLPRQWIEVGTAAVTRDVEGPTELEDALAYHLGGGWDFHSTRHLRVGLDLGFLYSRQDVDAPAAPGDSPRIDSWTWLVGARVSLDTRPAPFGVYVRGGGFWRLENDLGGADVADDQGGAYIGAGLDWWFRHDAVLSFFALHLEGSDGLDEDQVGLAARFHFDPEPDPSEEPDWWY